MKKIYLFTSMLFLFIGVTSNAQVVISQVYGGGGNSGATYTHDFIELFNRGTTSQNLTGWSVQYTSDTGTTWTNKTDLPNVTLQPGQYYLIQEATNAAVGIALPTPDLNGISSASTTATGINLSGTKGKVVLASSTTFVTGANPIDSQVVDKVGFGSTATGFEGAPTASLSNSTSATRLNGGCTDNNNNSTDFTIGAPSPRNSATAANICSTTPSISIVSPSNATIYNPLTTSVTVNISVSNFTVANGAGHIHYTLDNGTAVEKNDTNPIILSGLAAGSHTLVVTLVDTNHALLTPTASATTQFTIASFTQVANIKALRDDVIANGYGKYYQLNNTPTVTYARSASNRNQKYIQDSTAAMLIDDSTGLITTPSNIGDNLAGLKGQSYNFFGVLEFVPIANATVASSNNNIVPEIVTAAAINTNIEAYESELVQINGLTFTTGNGTATFTTTSADYATTDAANTPLIFRSLFLEANYLVAGSNIIPTGANNIIVLVSENNSVAKVVSRTLSDLTLAVVQNEIAGLKVYPNPVSNGVLHIESNLNTERTISLFDVLGKEVMKTTTSNTTLNIANLNSGIYIVKILENGKTATKKLVVN